MLSSRSLYCVFCSLLGAALAWLVLVAPPEVAAQGKGQVSFIEDVAPILKENCFACHDAKKKKGKLDLTTYEKLRTGGTKDDPVVPGMSRNSILMDVLTTTGPGRMPPKDAGSALPKEKIALIAKWIDQGAKLDSGIDAKADLVKELRVRWKPPQPPAAYKYPAVINAVAFTPDSKKLVVGGYHELTVWNVADGKLEKRVRTRAERAQAMVFLPDGKLAVAGSRPGQEGDVRIYDLNGPGKAEGGVAILDGVNDAKVLSKHLLDTDDSVLAIALSEDGKKLASGGCDRIVRVWDLASGKVEHAIENHADWVLGIAFSPDGKFLFTSSRDKTAKVWDLAAKESLLTFPDHQQPVYGVAASSDGKSGFSVGEDNNLRQWNAVGTGKNLGKQIRAVGHGKPVFRVVLHGDKKGGLLATCSADTNVRLFNPANGQALKTLSGHKDWVYALAISPDGQNVASGSWDGEVRIWKTDGTLLRSFNASPGYVPRTVSAKK